MVRLINSVDNKIYENIENIPIELAQALLQLRL